MIVTTTAPADINDIEVPQHPDGADWRYFMLSGHGAHFADSCTELLNVLIPGYADLDDEEASQVAYDHAVRIATSLQTTQMLENEHFSPAGEDDETLTALMQERDRPFTGTSPWDHQVALVTIDRHYEPFTDLRVPEGNVLMLAPSDELSYLESLDNAGYVMFMPSSTAS